MRRSCAIYICWSHLVQNSEFGDTKLENRLKTKCAKEVWEKASEKMERHTMKPHVEHIDQIRVRVLTCIDVSTIKRIQKLKME